MRPTKIIDVIRRVISAAYFFCAIAAISIIPVAAQTTDPVTVRPGDKVVDGRIFKAHLSKITQSSIRNGQRQLMWTATNDALIEKLNGKAVLRIVTKGASDIEPKRSWDGDILMYLRSLEPISWDWKYNNGNSTIFKFDGTQVSGSIKVPAKNIDQKLDEDLKMATSISGIEDVLVGALPLKLGYSAKIPVYQPGEPGVEWKTYVVTAREEQTIRGHRLRAWVVEENGKYPNKMWLIDGPPYLVKWEYKMPDGGIIVLDQELVSLH